MRTLKNILFLVAMTTFTGCADPVTEVYSSETIQEFVLTMFSDAAGITLTNHPGGNGAEVTGNVTRVYMNLNGYSMVRGQFASSLTSATIRCRIEYSLDNGSNWSTLVDNFAAATTANAHNNSEWTSIPEEAKTNVLLRAVIVGDGALDPIIRYIRLGYY